MQIDRVLRPLIVRLPSWVTPNAITAVRGLLLVPILLLHADYPLVAGWGVYLPAMLLDAVDGPLARHRGITSEAGAFFDATVDKTLLHGIIWLVLLPRVGLPLAIMLAVLDAALTGIRPLKRWRKKSVQANVFGKAKTIVMAFGVGFALSCVPVIVQFGIPFLGLSAALAGASLFAQIDDLFFGKPAS